MAKRFRLDGLLKMLERDRDLCQGRVNDHQAHLDRIGAECRLIWENLERLQEDFARQAQRGETVQMLSYNAAHFQRQRDSLKNLVILYRHVEQELEELNQALLKSKQAVRRVELLKERRLEQEHAEMLAVEQATLDEFGTLQAARQAL